MRQGLPDNWLYADLNGSTILKVLGSASLATVWMNVRPLASGWDYRGCEYRGNEMGKWLNVQQRWHSRLSRVWAVSFCHCLIH